MTYEKNPFEYENIPDYAMKPAQEAEKIDKIQMDQFDPTPYDRILGAAQSEYSSPTLDASESYNYAEAMDKYPSKIQPVAEIQPVQEESIVAQMPEEPVIAQVPEEPIMAQIPEEPIIAQVSDENSAEPLEVKNDLSIEAMVEPADRIVDEPIEEVMGQFADEIAVQPVIAPPTKVASVKIVPLVGSLVSGKLKLMDVKDKAKTKVYIEEDVLVPDVKPDLSMILSIDGKVKLSDKEISAGQNGADYIKVTGDLVTETLYLPDTQVPGENIISIESKLPFKNDCIVGAAPNSKLIVHPEIENIDYTIINERKIRIKATISLGIKEYGSLDVDLFEGVKDEEVQMLKEKIRATDVAMRKTNPMEIKEELLLKDSMPEIDKILKYDINVVENHKQITKDKAVINASIYCNVMYLGTSSNSDLAKASEPGAEIQLEPVLYQGKTEFTQFIKLADELDLDNKNLVGSKVDFDINNFVIDKKVDENGKAIGFDLESNIDTTLELYQNLEKEIVTDVYHNIKDIQYETEEIGLMSLSGSGASEVSVREIINIPERYGPVDHIAYMSGEIKETNASVDEGKSTVEGFATIKLILVSADENKAVYSIKQEIPFRSNIEISGAKPNMKSANQLTLKDLWFDKINNRQIEVNAGIAVNTTVSKEEKHRIIKNVSFIESTNEEANQPSIILYITKPGDNIWKIAKKYRTTVEELKKINDLEYTNEIAPGTKLLIVTKRH